VDRGGPPPGVGATITRDRAQTAEATTVIPISFDLDFVPVASSRCTARARSTSSLAGVRSATGDGARARGRARADPQRGSDEGARGGQDETTTRLIAAAGWPTRLSSQPRERLADQARACNSARPRCGRRSRCVTSLLEARRRTRDRRRRGRRRRRRAARDLGRGPDREPRDPATRTASKSSTAGSSEGAASVRPHARSGGDEDVLPRGPRPSGQLAQPCRRAPEGSVLVSSSRTLATLRWAPACRAARCRHRCVAEVAT